ncbi:uncharacterized protein LOC114324524 isoform X1 [Diabrotica virgifera virgifera]|uniref:Transcription factor Adf-1-like n=1 Tax=Diabrotica virgifera virgifera TaxID=50390 RepID=A0ABM5I9U0_DIAVI|nr:uncharacterized protein LOC114324524 isoform X1 [Diabrotica virgifera virgifera]
MDKLDKHKLISCVFMREPIWNKENKFHTHSLVLSKLWQEVATECGTTVIIARNRWKRLREQFLRKIEDVPINHFGDRFEEEHLSWQYFESLLFLKDQRIVRRGKRNFPTEDEAEVENSTWLLEGRDDEGDQSILKRSKGDFPTQEDETSTLLSEGRDDEGEAPNTDEFFFTETTSDVLREVSPAHTSSFSSFPKKSKKNTEIDEDEAFFNSTLPHLKTLTPKQKLKFRINVMQLLDNEIPSTTKPTGPNNKNNNG